MSIIATIVDHGNDVTAEDPFALDVQITTDVATDLAAVRCSTNDGCATTCASSCASRG